ncbi:Polyisoprenoid-binding protein YceI [Marivirga sericea]|uniref:Polyisoprenoid-binding protein YceI n=1 Tax=Marivirga sericea TaxID=1028 RepID=A0A1X7KWT5_9BACT|nr:YceI family protein [Marivirga sericea]SMG45807.1 Polyisoprenoid-binding protein YceI [Marivirga sericea]
MKTKILSIGLAALIMTAAFTVLQKEVKVDTNSSQIAWVGKKVTGQHNGIVNIKEGALEMEEGQVTGGFFVIDMTTIDVLDLEGEYKGKLMGHLRSDDFFSVEKYPTAKFTITSIDKSEATDATHFIAGDLTIKGITNKITFPATVTIKDGKANAKASFALDRTKWEVRYGSGSFFDGLGDKMIYDDFELSVNLSSL